MTIAQVAPLHESVPPQRYGGTERVVSYLTEELVARGHEVTLFALGDSRTSARLFSVCDHALRGSRVYADPVVYHLLLLEELRRHAGDFDLIHFHIDYLHYPLSRLVGWKCLSTLHGRLDLPDWVPLYREYRETAVVSISKAQRKPLPWLNWVGNVYHGIPENLYRFNFCPEDYLAFVGRISPEKGLDRAIEIAQRSGLKLRVAAKIDPANESYYHDVIRPLFARCQVEYLGEIDDREKQELLGKARAMLFPIDWPKPFGLVMVEAMACGTPTIAFPAGSVPEIVTHGVNGFIVPSTEAAVHAVERIDLISRASCRRLFESRFSVSHMAHAYLRLYESVLRGKDSAVAGVRNGRNYPSKRSSLRPGYLFPS